MEKLKSIKPPLGLIPKWVRENERFNEVRFAIIRYYDAEIEIPIKWVTEYNELIKKKKTEKPKLVIPKTTKQQRVQLNEGMKKKK